MESSESSPKFLIASNLSEELLLEKTRLTKELLEVTRAQYKATDGVLSGLQNETPGAMKYIEFEDIVVKFFQTKDYPEVLSGSMDIKSLETIDCIGVEVDQEIFSVKIPIGAMASSKFLSGIAGDEPISVVVVYVGEAGSKAVIAGLGAGYKTKFMASPYERLQCCLVTIPVTTLDVL